MQGSFNCLTVVVNAVRQPAALARML